MTRRAWTVVIVVVAVIVAAVAGTAPGRGGPPPAAKRAWPQSHGSASRAASPASRTGSPGKAGKAAAPGWNGGQRPERRRLPLGRRWARPRSGGGMMSRGGWQPLRGIPWLVLGLLIGAGVTVLVWQPWRRPARSPPLATGDWRRGRATADQWAQWHRDLHAADEATTQPIRDRRAGAAAAESASCRRPETTEVEAAGRAGRRQGDVKSLRLRDGIHRIRGRAVEEHAHVARHGAARSRTSRSRRSAPLAIVVDGARASAGGRWTCTTRRRAARVVAVAHSASAQGARRRGSTPRSSSSHCAPRAVQAVPRRPSTASSEASPALALRSQPRGAPALSRPEAAAGAAAPPGRRRPRRRAPCRLIPACHE